MSRMTRAKEAKAEVQKAALARWTARANSRDYWKAIIAADGPGAADSLDRQEKYRKRVQDIEMLRTIGRRVEFPFGVERRINLIWEPVPTPPSERARKAGRPVARIVGSADPNIDGEWLATGFLVAPDLLMTNWHVFPSRDEAVGCGANFLYEQTDRGVSRGITFALEPERFFVSDKDLDFCILGVASRSDAGDNLVDLGQITLVEARPKILLGHPVNIIQHPEGRPKEYAFAGNRLVDILEEEGFLQYETDTLEGSSGSPAFSAFWELVALHHASIPEMRDGVVWARTDMPWTEDMGDQAVHWIANEGTRISAIVQRLATMTLSSPSERATLRSLLASTADPVSEAAVAVRGAFGTENSPPASSSDLSMPGFREGDQKVTGIQFTFTGPVTINVSAAPTSLPPATTMAAPKAVERSIRFDPDYDNRRGYAENFLDPDGAIVVPIPKVADSRLDEIYKEDGEPRVLKYHHFELVMNRSRRLLMWSAANVDYDPDRKIKGERGAWGSDRWIPDPRIPAAVQIFDADFYKPAGNIDRGHIVRREDNEWGDSATEIEFANSDTFHWTNCTPQHEAFNQSDPARNDQTYRGMEGIWGALENHVQRSRSGNDTKACIIAGPILADDDPERDFGRGNIQYPLRFYKIICVVDGAGDEKQLRVFGFILNQSDVVDRFGIERFEAGRFGRYQKSLKEIEAVAGIVLDQALHDADTYSG
jgi:endonuclease G, mitochondrial